MAVDEPHAVGKDRLVDAAYAAANFPLPVITVDLGTATTFNVVDKDRVFRGGVPSCRRCIWVRPRAPSAPIPKNACFPAR